MKKTWMHDCMMDNCIYWNLVNCIEIYSKNSRELQRSWRGKNTRRRRRGKCAKKRWTVAYLTTWISSDAFRGHREAATILIQPGGLFVSFVSRFAGLFRIPRGFSFLVVYLIPFLRVIVPAQAVDRTTTCYSRFSLPFSFLFPSSAYLARCEINERSLRFWLGVRSPRVRATIMYFQRSDLPHVKRFRIR